MSADPFDLDDLEPSPQASAAHQPGHDAAPPYLDGLNEPQREAVLATDGPVLVLAGAGTGKTRVLTTRLGHLMATGRAAPWNILAVTFTNKAAKEMQERVARVIGRPVEGMWIGTFHSICVRILRRHAELVGLKSNFTILDTDDQIRLLKQLIQAENIDDKRWPARQLAGLIDRWKNRALTPEKVPSGESYAFANGLGGELYKAYQERLKVLNACDFGDLLMHVITLFQSHADVLAEYHRQFRYILVDEYQDTNVSQYLWLRLLAQAERNICCVGDDDQSIYGWRGAEVGNILRFSDDFPGAKVVRLEQNYRSTGHILAAASALISANEGRLGKELWTDSGEGEKVQVKGVWDAPEEARAIGEDIENLQRKQVSLSEIAVLVRAGFQTREFEERMITLGLPYRVVGGPRFYERAEIRDAMAYLRVIAQPDDDLAFERIVNVPKRGLGATTIQKIHHLARSHGVSMTRAARQILELNELRAAARKSLSGLMDDFDRWRGMVETENHSQLAQIVLEESGYTDMWQQDKSPDAPGRLDNLKEMVSAMGDFENLAGFLEHISLVMENESNDSREKVSLMTLHAAKGLEFDHVFLPGWEEGVFPNQRALDETGAKGLEEERRLAYVGITRAKQQAYVYFAGNRQVFGQWQSSLPSRFIEELPEDHIEMESAQGLYGNRANRGGWGDSDWSDEGYFTSSGDKYGPGWQRAQKRGGGGFSSPGTSYGDKVSRRKRSVTIDMPKATPAPSTEVSDFAVGERVFHDKFGYGMIEDVEGNKLLVAFDKAGTKRVVDRFVKPA
ncbi:MAG: UvrD-helicase domain-containing protein [Kordiimonadaceae bacterium]|nr:UvrD-helicase domain-containing protein [Kordiimonadaceae bacterium]MBO6569025.1 UvrD-helicase domain-containing protein [Kordiimonadaceae bacterium]MBO6964500.1 UvrD-helicase domain-containing protein [Kordiimonadaceae bacterium]